MEKNIIWIASFPKSGNTWTRFLLNALMHKNVAEDINKAGKISGACTAKSMLKPYMGDEEAPPTERLKQRGDALRQLSAAYPGKKLLMKTHSALAQLGGKDQIPLDCSLGGILVVRNPFDVLCSCMNHFGFDQERAYEFIEKLQSTIGETDKHYPVLTTNWDGFAQSWMSAKGMPVLLVRYEDLQSHPFSVCKKISTFFNLKANENQIIDAIVANRFGNLQKMEDEQGFNEASEKGERFFYRGEVGYFKETLPVELIEKIAERFKPMMTRLGYAYENGDLVIKPIPIPQKKAEPKKASSAA